VRPLAILHTLVESGYIAHVTHMGESTAAVSSHMLTR
jgi:hypothetical protein